MTTIYRYTALNPQGKKLKGILETTTLQEAKEKLRLQGVIVLKLIPFQKKGKRFSKKKDLKKEVLVTFTMQLAELTSAKIPLYESLISLEEMYRNEGFHPIVLSLAEDIKKGIALSTSMSKYPNSFNSLYVAMVKAGESIGAIDISLSRLATLLLKQNQLKKKLYTATLYPFLLLSFSLFVMGTLLIFVIPSMEPLFADRNVNGFTKLVFTISHFVTKMYPIYLPICGMIIATLLVLFRKNREQFKQKIFKLPVIKKVVVETAIARFTRTLSSLLQGGIPMKESLGKARVVLGIFEMEKAVLEAEKKIIEGSYLSIELKKSSYFPPLVSRMVAIGEEGGNLSTMLGKVADFFEEEVEKKVSRIVSLSPPLILLVMGFFVGLIMMGVLLPLTDVNLFIGD